MRRGSQPNGAVGEHADLRTIHRDNLIAHLEPRLGSRRALLNGGNRAHLHHQADVLGPIGGDLYGDVLR